MSRAPEGKVACSPSVRQSMLREQAGIDDPPELRRPGRRPPSYKLGGGSAGRSS
jgi:hypothetical protein